MDNEHMPHLNVEQELYWRELWPFNLHINHDKLAWFVDCFEPAFVHRLDDHFSFWDADHWTIVTSEQSGAATEAIDPTNPCGVLQVQNGEADDDSDEILTQCTWAFAKGYPLFFEMRVMLSDGLDSDAYAGFLGAPYFGGAAQEGIFFLKPDDTRRLYFCTLTAGQIVMHDTGWDVNDETWGRIWLHWDGEGNVRWFVISDTTQKIVAMGVVTTGFTVGQIFYFAFGVRNGEADAKSLFTDYLKIAQKLHTGA